MSSLRGDKEDLTRKQRREQARAQRKQLEQAEAAGATRRKRIRQLGIIVAGVVAIIVVVLIATGGSGGTKKVQSGTKAANETVAQVSANIGGIPQNGNTIGYPNAPVTLQYFGDLQCPVCKQFTIAALPSIIQKWVRTGKLKIEYRSMKTATQEPETFDTQQVAALAAGKQAKMWYYLELFYREQQEENSGYVNEHFLQNLAQQVPGLTLAKWTSDRSDPALSNEVVTDAQAANSEGFTGTPSFLIGKTGGAMHKLEAGTVSSSAPYDAAIEKQLKS